MYGIVVIVLLCFVEVTSSTVCSIRDHVRYGGPCHYNASSGITFGALQPPASGYVNGTGIHSGKLVKTYSGPMDQVTDWGPVGGYKSSSTQYQINVERSPSVHTYTQCDNLPYGSVEEKNLIAAHMDGNREDPDLYVVSLQPEASSMYVCTPVYEQRCLTFASGFTQYDLSSTSQASCNGLYILSPSMSVCELEQGIQWTMTGYGLTELRGNVTFTNDKTYLYVKDSEFRHTGQFNQHVYSLPADTMTLEVTRTHVQFRQVSNAFLPYYGKMYTELIAYVGDTNHPTTNWVAHSFDVELNTSIPCKLYCHGNTYLFNFTCVNHTMTSKSECLGGEFTHGTNITDSTCVPCVDSFDFSNICMPYTYTDETCKRGVFTPGTNTSDSTCVACPTTEYLFENACRDCANLKTHFHFENCCTGTNQLETPYNLKVQPYRAVCQEILDAWRYDCDGQCYD